MRSNTIVMLIIALVFGAIAVFLANMWLTGQQSRQVAKPAEPARIETETIVVAVRELSFGEPLKNEVLREIPWPKSAIPDGAFAKITDVNKDGSRVVLTNIGTNEPVLKWKISGPGERASLSAIVTEGMRAVAIRVNDVVGVAGFVLPGDRVDVLYSRGGSDSSGDTIDVLLQNVRILAVNHLVDEKKSEPIAAKVVTVEVKPTDAQMLSLAQKTGSLTLTLRAAGSLDQAPAQRVVEQELVSNPSVYMEAFDAQKAANEALNARIQGLEGNLASSKEQLANKVGSIEQQLQNSGAVLKAQLAALEAVVQQTAAKTGQDEQALRAKLAALEGNIRKAMADGSAQTDAALRAKLAEFEANLRELSSKDGKPVVTEPIIQFAPVKPQTASVKMYRGMTANTYQVPVDQAPVDVTQFVVEQQ